MQFLQIPSTQPATEQYNRKHSDAAGWTARYGRCNPLPAEVSGGEVPADCCSDAAHRVATATPELPATLDADGKTAPSRRFQLGRLN
jgi:hypothetical protein